LSDNIFALAMFRNMFPETKKDNFSSTLCEESGGEKIENRDFKRSIRKGGIHKKYIIEEDIKQRRNCYKTWKKLEKRRAYFILSLAKRDLR